ncbi:hypothetical protein BN8_00175 [Fibrisoma limi BUZ 3]|uniref:Uncharacterized protein n=1 Tax=Fibrisoma limi BUZ 3 TaxID=1185876 RepID=I2GBI4_9BACT|nr:hypothetical protein BN8_00175 [Fibrisoma limi BUZ 3]
MATVIQATAAAETAVAAKPKRTTQKSGVQD